MKIKEQVILEENDGTSQLVTEVDVRNNLLEGGADDFA
jgi:hypothetical protein